MRDFIYLILMLTFNGTGAYLAYRLITWFETGRQHLEPQPRQNVRKGVK